MKTLTQLRREMATIKCNPNYNKGYHNNQAWLQVEWALNQAEAKAKRTNAARRLRHEPMTSLGLARFRRWCLGRVYR